MPDPDISTAEALRRLHQPETDPYALDRRRFLQLVGMGLGAGLVAGPGGSLLDAAIRGHDPSAWAAGPIGPSDGVLVVIGLFGGNDGLNTVVPLDDGNYYDQHRALAIPGHQTLALDAGSGLNPALTEMKRFWDDGRLAIVEGVGAPDPDLSHFNSMARWMSGTVAGVPSTGWIGRWLDGYLGGGPDLYAAAEIGNSVPLHLIGHQARGSVVPAGRPGFGVASSEHDGRRFATIRALNAAPPTTWLGQVGQAMVDQLDMAATLAPVIPDELPPTRIVARLEVIARLINANLGFRVLTAGHGDYDSHAGQPDQHPARMEELNAALARFFELLNAQWAGRVTVMTFSEFGRTSWDNDGRGTDHGTAGPQFVLGANVRGGFYGQRPSLAGLRRWDRMRHHVDFRDYFGSVVDGWLGGGGSDVFGGRAIDDLGLFRAAPSSGGGGGGGVPGAAIGNFVSVSPARVRDSRIGIGGPAAPIGPGQVRDVQITGRGGIPASGVTAVAVNVTSTNVTQPTYFTVFPAGTSRPDTSSLNPVPGRAVPNMTVVDVGAGGRISVFNHSGTADYLVDVLGYFRAESGARLAPLTPSRLLDTRTGVGAPRRRVRGGSHIDLVVAGRGGVPAVGADAVILNVTSVEPTANGYVTVWPSGGPRPDVSALNYAKGMVIPNLVICKVGSGGAVSLFASDGEVDLLADVVGCFAADGSRHVGIRPARILDTRNGVGAPRRRVGGSGELDVVVAGRGGVPTNAKAAILNVTVVGPTHSTFVTTYPDGGSRPNASSHNASPGQTVANLTISKVGEGGKIRLYNAFGAVDLIADVTGYFL